MLFMQTEMKAMAKLANVDPEEIRKFDRLAQIWRDPDGPMGMLHVINPLRTRFIKNNGSLRHKKALDVGCGAGLLAESMAFEGAEVTGIDPAQTSLKIARQHAEKAGLAIEYISTSVEELALDRSGAFDIVTCLEALEHVPDPKKVVDACARLLKPGGCLFFSTINRSLKSFLFAIVGAEYLLRMLPRGTHQYRKLIKPEELDKWVRDNGFRLSEVASFIYNPLTRSFKMRPGADVNYITCYKR